jgi:hypothetical protein
MWCPSTKREFIEGVSPEVIKQVGLDADALQAKALGITLEEYLDSNFLET